MLSTGKGNAWLGVWVNAAAITVILEGALGGSALFDSAPVAPELTSPQRALVDRVTRNLFVDLESSIEVHTGHRATGKPEAPHRVESDAMYVVCEIENLSIPAAVIIAASSEVLTRALDLRTHQRQGEYNPEMLASLSGVEVELVAELGRATMALRQALDLSVGDVVRLNTTDNDSVCVRVGGIRKFEAVPVTSRGQMAVEIRSRHVR
jgi:flagellar motor switch protein FliM